MPPHSAESPVSLRMWQGIRPAMDALLKASDCAADTDSQLWDFAISMKRMLKLGVSETDLRWLIRKGYITHGTEVTVPGDEGREFRSIANMTFDRRTCFVLTDAGAEVFVSGHCDDASLDSHDAGISACNQSHLGQSLLTPHWDAELRRLRLDGQLIKRFKWPAVNQEAVLGVFQEEGWPCRIDDPLPPHADQDPKRRLADTIKCLNRKQIHEGVHFRGDGTGQGVIWELVEKTSGTRGIV